MENIQYGVALEASASTLTQGLGGRFTESCCSQHYKF